MAVEQHIFVRFNLSFNICDSQGDFGETGFKLGLQADPHRPWAERAVGPFSVGVIWSQLLSIKASIKRPLLAR